MTKRILRSAGCIVALASPAHAAAAPEIVLQTGGNESIVSDFRALQPITTPNTAVRFDFGLATIEEALAGSFLDSATLTLQGATPGATTIIATLDRNGVTWAPPVPGGISLEPGSVVWTEIQFPEDLDPTLPHRRAFSVTTEIPAALQGMELTFRFDLFDNLNGLDSVAFVSAPIVVPEPTTYALALAGALFLFSFNRRNK